MTTKVIVPQLGESVVEATVGAWQKQVGDAVAVGDVLVELQTDKVDVEVGAETAGVLASIERPTGADVVIGDVLAVIAPAGMPDAVPAPQPVVPQPIPRKRQRRRRPRWPAAWLARLAWTCARCPVLARPGG